MVKSISVPAHLSHLQKTRLLKGMKVHLHPTKAANSSILLDPRQARSYLTRRSKGTGYRVQLQPPHAHLTLQHGEGFGDFLKKAASLAQRGLALVPDSIKDTIKDKALDLAKDQGKKLAGMALDKAGLGSLGSAIGLSGSGMKRRRGSGIMAPGGGGIMAPGFY